MLRFSCAKQAPTQMQVAYSDTKTQKALGRQDAVSRQTASLRDRLPMVTAD